MRFEIVNVTPELAAKMLANNEGNRKLRMHRVAFLAKAIETGHFQLTHQAVALTKKGRLLDGQHRLRAIVLAGRPVKMVIARDVPEETFPVLDAGLPRSMAERLHSDRKHTEVMRMMLRLMANKAVSHEYEVELCLETFDDALKAYSSVGKPSKGHTKFQRSAYAAAILLRVAHWQKAKDKDAVLRAQWLLEKCYRGDLVGAPPVIHSFYRQVIEGVANLDLGVSPPTDQFARAWRAFNPELEGVQRLQVNDHSAELRDARLVFSVVSQGVFT